MGSVVAGDSVVVIKDNCLYSKSLGQKDLTGCKGKVSSVEDEEVIVTLTVEGKDYNNVNFDFDEVEADSPEEAFELAENMLPSCVSDLESYGAELEELE